ncbi:hypothetical protein J2R76_003763 [Bradyrhizobium sp. USDA 4532]|uniref:hypothetical protein n=1 Tax=unclassified Bradyrhizobium TaxID=2631580 RepID=UPI0020A2167C|nr:MULTISPECIES: hypothetical protein [unclassified Bradyrhizobium]MCP1835426.1 hypothetical protein [Bradyrhizobium sp. USDA 4545]MCP1920172.1 hypothetical protein [Bradyrhizobium sp. USDA 4532]
MQKQSAQGAYPRDTPCDEVYSYAPAASRPKAAEPEIAIPERIAKGRAQLLLPARAADPNRAFNLFDNDCQGISLRIGAAIYYSRPARLAAPSLGPGVPEKERSI